MIQWLDRPFVDLKKYPAVPNCDTRHGSAVDAIFLHYTAGGLLENALTWFGNSAAHASAHFIVGRDGHIVQCVPLDQRAWHAGVGAFPINGKEDSAWPDKCAIGIEMCNFGLLHQDHSGKFYWEAGTDLKPYDLAKYGKPQPAKLLFSGARGVKPNGMVQMIEGFWEPYPNVQIEAVVKLCGALLEEFNIPIQRIVGHEDVALPQGRKTDPGPLFPWTRVVNELCAVRSVALPQDVWSLRKTAVTT